MSLMDGKNNTSIGLNVDHVHGADNTVIGAYAGVLDTASRGVVFVGANAGRKAQRSLDSVAVGWGSMASAHTTQKSVFVGTDTGKNARQASYCTAIGYASGSNLGVALRTTLVGSRAGQFAINSVDDTFVGYGAGMRFMNGSRNACLGAFSAHDLEFGSDNVLIGYSAGKHIRSAHGIVGIGPFALENADNSSNVIAIGPGAGRYAANAENSMFVGTDAGAAASGGFNVYVGPLAGNAGSFNTMVGYGTGERALGNNNTCLGYLTGSNANGGDNTMLGYMTGNTISGSKNVLVGSGARVDGDFNVCVGFESGNAVTVVSNSTFIGAGSGCDGDGNSILGTNAGSQGVGSNNAVIGFQTAQHLSGSNNVIAGSGSANHVQAQNSVIVGPQNFQQGSNSHVINLVNSVTIGSGITSSNTTILGNAVILGQVAVSDLDSGAFVVGSAGSRVLFANSTVFGIQGVLQTKVIFADQTNFQVGDNQDGGPVWGNGFTGHANVMVYDPFDSFASRLVFNRASAQYLQGGSKDFFTWKMGDPGSAGISIFVRFKFTGTAGNNEPILDCGNGPTDNNIVISRIGTTNQLAFTIYNGATPYTVQSITPILQNTWYVLGFRVSTPIDVSNPFPAVLQMYLYKPSVRLIQLGSSDGFNDFLEQQTTFTNTYFTSRTLTNTYVGRSNRNTDAYLNGEVSGLMVYNRSLSNNEMVRGGQFLYNYDTIVYGAAVFINAPTISSPSTKTALANAAHFQIGPDHAPVVLAASDGFKVGVEGARYVSIQKLTRSTYIGEDTGRGSNGNYNTFIGPQAGQYLTTDSAGTGYNVGMGKSAGLLMNGKENVVVGAEAGGYSAGIGNFYAGPQCGKWASGDYNCAIGKLAFGYNSVVVSGIRLPLGSYNIALGQASAQRMVGSYNTAIGRLSGSELTGNLNTMIGQSAGSGLQGNKNIVLGDNVASTVIGSDNIVIGDGVGPGTVRLNSSVAIGTNIRSTAATSIMSNSVILGSSIIATGDLVNSVVLGSGMSLSSSGADDNKCIIGIAGQRAIEATAYSLRLGESTNTFLEANASTFILGPTDRPHMQVNRQAEGISWNNSRTCFPASPTSMLRSLGYVGNTLVQCDSVPALRPRGSATPNFVNNRPYSSEANSRLPSDGDSSWFGVPVFVNAMGDTRYFNLCFRDDLSKSAHVDAIGQTLDGGSFSVEAWVLLEAAEFDDNNGPIFGSMNSDPVTLDGDVTDWALGISYYDVHGVGNSNTQYPTFMYTLPDKSGKMKLMANLTMMAAYTWYHLAVIGEAGKLYMFVDGQRVDMFQVPVSINKVDPLTKRWTEVQKANVAGIYSNVHVIPTAGFTTPPGIRDGFQGAGLRIGRVIYPPGPDYPVYYPYCKTAHVTEVMYRSPRFTSADVGYANNIDGFPKPTVARAVPPKTGVGATVYITPVGETPVLGANEFAELHGVRAGGFELWPYTRPNDKGLWWQSWVGENWFPMPRTMPDSSIRVFGGGCIHMQKMPIYLEVEGKYGISTNGSGVFPGIPAGTVIWGETGSIVCANPGKTHMVNIQKVMSWGRTNVSIARNTDVEGNMIISGNLQVTGNINGSIGTAPVIGNVAGNFNIGGNLTLGGVLATSDTSILTGFSGGPRITQKTWDSPGPTHVLDMNELTASCENVSGMLYLHTSSKANDNRNGMATLGIIKSSGYAPVVTVFTSQRSANLGMFTFSNDVQNTHLVVSTDAECAICWTFVSGA